MGCNRLSCTVVLLLVLASHTFAEPPNSCIIDPLELLVVVVGTTFRRPLLNVQQTTFGKFVKVVQFTEEDFPSCVRCAFKDKFRHAFHYINTKEGGPFMTKSHGWWCAQQRPLQAVGLALRNITSLPKFIFVIDDDTMVNPFQLKRLLLKMNPEERTYMGYHSRDRRMFIFGGGGWLVSRKVVEDLVQPSHATLFNFTGGNWVQVNGTQRLLDDCISRQLGGSWCFAHSDHAVARCIKAASSIGPTLNMNFFQSQRGCLLPSAVSCHYASANNMMNVMNKFVDPACAGQQVQLGEQQAEDARRAEEMVRQEWQKFGWREGAKLVDGMTVLPQDPSAPA